ncbi:hypothetical protein Srot_0290 [Segniliparus rotundus DSM 44985]|uniref:Uncharacterized protein n=1 Tax=Segniliparus rotundus (strain ATCC BAA-972 / CDC 1076 / CIP 108378 / DSM 44985 / JCM 13578) TaxID=640132 RepID=D6ZB18_SEGRD|nr:hypothetical protein [Segniliparus rotundus]ADG96777.1 hypothetical protein Srot_0290 [Segniliparus rotundus DSM 44985]
MRLTHTWFSALAAAFALASCHAPDDGQGSSSSAQHHAVGASTAATAPLPTDFPGIPAGAVVAYHDGDGVKVITAIPAATQASFGAKDTGAPSFTADGKHVFASVGKANRQDADQILDFDVATRTVRSIACPCAKAVAASGSMLVWWEDPDRLMSLDLREPDPKPKILRTVQLPTPAPDKIQGELSWQPSGTAVIGASRDIVLIGRLPTKPLPTGGPTYLFTVQDDGTARSLGAANSDGPVTRALFSPGGKQFAYIGRYRASSNSRSASVSIVDTSTWQTQTPSIADSSSPGVVPGVTSLWWDSDGALDTVYYSDKEGSPSPMTTVTPPNIWTLTDQTWKQIGFDGERWLYHLAPGAILTLGRSNPRDEHSVSTTLSMEVQGRRAQIAEGVTAVAAMSARQ